MALEFDTTNLLRPNQIQDAQDELARLSGMINAPNHIRAQISDMGELRKRLKNLKVELDKQTPRAFVPAERDAAVAEFQKLSEFIRNGMPSSEEMRRNPPGAVGKQLDWQERTKKAVARYKHLALRLQAGGDLPLHLKRTRDAANIELLRPLKTSHQLSMDSAQIPKATDYHFGDDIANTTVFNDEEIAAVEEADPEIAAALSVMTSEQRALIKKAIEEVRNPKAPKKKKTRKKSAYTALQQLAKQHQVKSFGRPKADILAGLAAKGVTMEQQQE